MDIRCARGWGKDEKIGIEYGGEMERGEKKVERPVLEADPAECWMLTPMMIMMMMIKLIVQYLVHRVRQLCTKAIRKC